MINVDSWRSQHPLFLQKQEMGQFDVDVGFKDWVNLGAVIPKAIQPTEGTKRLRGCISAMDSSKELFFAAEAGI